MAFPGLLVQSQGEPRLLLPGVAGRGATAGICAQGCGRKALCASTPGNTRTWAGGTVICPDSSLAREAPCSSEQGLFSRQHSWKLSDLTQTDEAPS